jgi:hypothetical protein
MKLETTKIVGDAAELSWTQAQTASGEEGRELLLVVKLSREDESTLVDLPTIGGEILLELGKMATQTVDRGSLKQTVEKVVGGLGEGIVTEIGVAYRDGDKLRVFGIGAVACYLARNKQLANLWEEQSKVVVEGTLKENDRIILITKKLVDEVGLVKIKEIVLNDRQPEEILATLVHTNTDSSGMAAVVSSVTNEKVESRLPELKLQISEPRRMNLWVGGAILIAMIVMIGVGMVQRVKVEAEKKYVEMANLVNQEMNEATSAVELDPGKTRELLTQAREQVNTYLASKAKDEYKIRAKDLITQLDQTEQKAFKKSNVQLSTVVELSILADGLTADKIQNDGKGNLIFLDKNNTRIVGMNLTDRSRIIVPTGQIGQLTDIATSDSNLYGLDSKGVVMTSWKKPDLKRVIEPDEFWQQPVEIQTFAGNVYVLDKGQSEIWKYPTLGDTTFGGRRRWFAAGITPDLSNVVEMKITGDAWLLTSTGKLLRYTRGAPAAFSMDGLPTKDGSKNLDDPVAIYVSSSAVYVLERGGARVIVLGLDGKYQAQYSNQEFAKTSGITVVDSTVYVLINNVVKSFGL